MRYTLKADNRGHKNNPPFFTFRHYLRKMMCELQRRPAVKINSIQRLLYRGSQEMTGVLSTSIIYQQTNIQLLRFVFDDLDTCVP